ncbi:MAG: hypothetical protein KGZ41_08820 [Dethiobacter sp.]|jgi:hypothetical protein|nr:hypothetical protein [Dethiobacter sp.]
MKMTGKPDYGKLQTKLENLELPEVQIPANQLRLRQTLLASACFKKEVTLLPVQQKIRARVFNVRPAAWTLVASLTILLLTLGTYRTFFTAPQAVASLTMQVNPAITMTISAGYKVITANGLDADGQALLAELDLSGQNVREALRIIADALREGGLLSPERRIIIAVHPVGDRLAATDLAALSGNVRRTIDEYLADHGLSLKVTNSELTAEFTEAAADAGLLPADYVDLVAAVGSPLAWQILNLYKELSISPVLFREKLDTITEAIIELMEEKGLNKQEALTMIKEAIKADPTLEGFNELHEIPDAPEEETNAVEDGESGKPDDVQSDHDAPDKYLNEREESDRHKRDQLKPDAFNEDTAEGYESDKPARDESKPDASGEETTETEEDALQSGNELQKPADSSEEH